MTEMPRNLLVVCYYWPPSGGGGVQRWLKFTKYLPEYGYDPIVYTPKNPSSPVLDDNLLRDISPRVRVFKKSIIEPFGLYRLLTGKKPGESQGAAFASESSRSPWKERLANLIRSNLFIPDARVLWVKPSVRYLTEFLRREEINLVVTTGPPHSLHLIGLHLKRKLGIRWIADFRDPWSGIDYYDELLMSRWADRRQKNLESRVLRSADLVIAVSPSNGEELRSKGARDVRVITNGYDPTDMDTGPVTLDREFSLAHTGTFMPNRNQDLLWRCLRELRDENEGFRHNFRLRLTGKTDAGIMEALRKHGLDPCTDVSGYMPHDESVRMMKRSRLLLLAINQTGSNRGMLTGKLYEYLASGRPILAIGPVEGDAAGILRQTGCGLISAFDDAAGLKRNILHFYSQYLQGSREPVGIISEVEKYSRRKLSGDLAGLLDGFFTG